MLESQMKAIHPIMQNKELLERVDFKASQGHVTFFTSTDACLREYAQIYNVGNLQVRLGSSIGGAGGFYNCSS